MLQSKTTSRTQAWSVNLRPKVNEIVTHNSQTWVNVTGMNTEPSDTSTDWLQIGGGGAAASNLQAVTDEGATTNNGITITDTGEALRFMTTGEQDKYIEFDGGGDDFRLMHTTFDGGSGLESQLVLSAAPRITGVYSTLLTFTRVSSIFNKAISVVAASNQLSLQGTNTVTFNVDASITANRTLTFPNQDGRLALASEIVAGTSGVAQTINTSSAPTNASLNASFPDATNPIGTMVVNTNAAQTRLYIKITATNWLTFSGSALV